MFTNFDAYDFDDFRQTFLIEKNLDQTNLMKMGELSRKLSKVNIDAGKILTKWAKEIANKVERYIKKKKIQANLRIIPVGDIKTEAAAILVLKIDGKTIEASIFDNNKATVKLPPTIAKLVNKGKIRKYFHGGTAKDRLAAFLIGILEVVHDI